MSAADSYLPGHGDDRFGVEHYDLSLRYKPQGNHLEGRAVLRIIAGVELTDFVVDLYGLQVTSLRLEGAEVARWSHRAARLKVALRSATRAGARLTLTVAYRGSPGPMPGPDGLTGWEELTDGVLVAAQPHGAPTWFPCNDRMADKATYTIAVETDPAYRVVANGVLTEERRAGRRQRWVYEQYQPMATYLATLQIGRYVGEPQEGHPVPLWLVASPERMPRVRQAMADQPRMLEVFTQMFGPYPFDQYTSVVTDDPLEIPLESQTLSTFGSNHLSRGWPAQRLIAHELAHQWFGNAVTAASLADIWLHEGFACYAEWLWAQESGHSSTDAEAARHHAIMARRPQDLVLTAPGPEQVFDDRVYKRGALTLHAIRRTVGDDDFFDLLRTWVEAHCYEVVTTADFERTVEEVTGESHGALLDRWLRQQALPDLPGEEPPGLLQRAVPSVIRRIRG